jgi:hypothetical protein
MKTDPFGETALPSQPAPRRPSAIPGSLKVESSGTELACKEGKALDSSSIAMKNIGGSAIYWVLRNDSTISGKATQWSSAEATAGILPAGMATKISISALPGTCDLLKNARGQAVSRISVDYGAKEPVRLIVKLAAQ